MGTEALHTETIEPQGVLSSYTVIWLPASKLSEDAKAFVFSAWLKSLRKGNDFFKLIAARSYWRSIHRLIENVLASPITQVRFAVLSDDHDVILGFSVSRGTVLDFIYVKKDQRRCGIGTSLIPPGVETVTHLTKTALTIWANKYSHWEFDPFA